MKSFYERTAEVQELIRKVYRFESDAIRATSSEPNPYIPQLLAHEDGAELLEAINEALEMEFKG